MPAWFRSRAVVGGAAIAAAVVCVGLSVLAGPQPRPIVPTLPSEAGLGFDVRDADTGQLIPCKLTLDGVDGTVDPEFSHNDIGRAEGPNTIAAYSRVMSGTGSGAVHVPLGTYDVYVSRGPEWNVFVARKVKVTGKGARVVARLKHVIDTRGWLSADFHVHAAPSPDSSVPLEHRILQFVSDGVEMIVATDHNVVTDYEPAIRALDVGRYITSAMGDELTTNGWGHFGAFPLPRSLGGAGHGAVLVHGRSAKDFFNDVRVNAPGAIIDVHHPRIDEEVGYFNVGGFDPHQDRASRPGFSFDFDAVEVLNGYQDPVRRSVDRTIEDWYALLNHGHLATATGNSDTHHLTFNLGGYPRNYVRVLDDRPENVQPAEIARAVRGHHAFFTTAPFVRVRVGSAGIGDVAPAPGGHARVEIEVQAAPWVAVDRVTLVVNGKEAKKWDVPVSTEVVRFKEGFDVSVPRDGYLVVRVDGDKIMAPIVGDRKTFGVLPLALTNPVFLDVDGNGAYDPAVRHGPHAPPEEPGPRTPAPAR